jgi:hypothetical protein
MRSLRGVGIALIFVAILILGWAVGQPDPYEMEITTFIKDERYYMCDFNVGECGWIPVEDVRNQLLVNGLYRRL